jgi:hypothetical protein
MILPRINFSITGSRSRKSARVVVQDVGRKFHTLKIRLRFLHFVFGTFGLATLRAVSAGLDLYGTQYAGDDRGRSDEVNKVG